MLAQLDSSVVEAQVVHRGPAGWLTNEAACIALGVSVPTLARWRSKGMGPAFAKLGGRIFYRAVDVQTWLEAQVRL